MNIKNGCGPKHFINTFKDALLCPVSSSLCRTTPRGEEHMSQRSATSSTQPDHGGPETQEAAPDGTSCLINIVWTVQPTMAHTNSAALASNLDCGFTGITINCCGWFRRCKCVQWNKRTVFRLLPCEWHNTFLFFFTTKFATQLHAV